MSKGSYWCTTCGGDDLQYIGEDDEVLTLHCRECNKDLDLVKTGSDYLAMMRHEARRIFEAHLKRRDLADLITLWDKYLEIDAAYCAARRVELAVEHTCLCHSDGSECEDGCDAAPCKPVEPGSEITCAECPTMSVEEEQEIQVAQDAEKVVDAVGEALGVDTGTVHETKFAAAVAAVKALK